MQALWTFDDVLRALGGPSEVGRLTNNSASAVCGWRRERGCFPPKYYVVLKTALEDRGFYASPAVLGQWGNFNQSSAAA